MLSCTGLPYWFIVAYIILYALSPVLNSFIENADKKTFTYVLLGCFLVEFIYGRFGDQGHFQAGYSAISFVGLYLLSAYVRRYPFGLTKMPCWADLSVYAALVIAATAYNCLTPGGVPYGGPHSTFDYNNPIVIVSSLYFFLFFTKFKFDSKAVNWLAASAFSIYLIHMNFLVAPYYRGLFQSLFLRFNGASFFVIALMLVLLIGSFCILVDKARIWSWNKLWSMVETRTADKS